MPNEDDVNVVLFEKVDIDVFVLCPLSRHQILDVDLWITFSYNNFFFLLGNDWFFDLLWLLILGNFSLFFLFLIKFKIISLFLLLDVINLSFVELFSDWVCSVSIGLHCG